MDQDRREQICDEVEAALPLRGRDEVSVGVAMARKCSTDALLQVLVERSEGDEHAEATAEEIAEVERAECITDVVPAQNAMCTDRALVMLRKLAPVERTPETVLRAMLKAYEAAALNQEIAEHRKAPVRYRVTLHDYTGHMAALRLMLANVVVSGVAPSVADWPRTLVCDYEARLNGTTALNAPPAEV